MLSTERQRCCFSVDMFCQRCCFGNRQENSVVDNFVDAKGSGLLLKIIKMAPLFPTLFDAQNVSQNVLN